MWGYASFLPIEASGLSSLEAAVVVMVCDGGCLLALPLLSTKAEGNALVTRWSLLSSGCPWCAGWLLATGAGLGAPRGEARGSREEGAAGGCGRNLLEHSWPWAELCLPVVTPLCRSEREPPWLFAVLGILFFLCFVLLGQPVCDGVCGQGPGESSMVRPEGLS